MGHQAPSQEMYKLERQLQNERNIVHALQNQHQELLGYLSEFTQKALEALGENTYQQALEDWNECKNWLINFYTEAIQKLRELQINTHYEETFFATGQAALLKTRED